MPLDSASGSKAASSSSSANTPNNQLDGNSFITLLTAQLQAQDPLNPLDPNQMVSELTQMNTLQQIIQIREDLDGLLQGAQSGVNGGSLPPVSQTAAAAALASQNPSAKTALAGVLQSFGSGSSRL